MPHVRSAKLREVDSEGVWFQCNDGISCRIQVVTPYVMRVLFLRASGKPRQPRTWAVVPPSASDTPIDGYDRLGIPFPSKPGFSTVEKPESFTISTQFLQAVVHLDPFGIEWLSWQPSVVNPAVCLARDRPSRPYHLSASSHAFSHSMVRETGDVYMGLGDKTGDTNLHGRKLHIGMRDALGYDPQTGDPLYKHWPFLAVRDAATKICYGILYDNMAEADMDLGCEHSNYYGLYRTYAAEDGDLDMYFIIGPHLKDVVARKVLLTGRTALQPRWSLGFHCTAMPLADAQDAQKQMEGFIQQALASSVPCSAFHFGSGYTSIGKKRYVFHWNKQKFPEPESLIKKFKAAGMRVVANVKPCLLTDHPSYAELEAAGGFVAARPGSLAPAVSQFWDGDGAQVDFTNPLAIKWWQNHLQSALLDLGIDTAWNDNNEYEITEEAACSNNFGKEPLPLSITRPLHSLLMTRASFEQQLRSNPKERPYSVTRAGYFGIQRYAQTWTGDNSTSWTSLKWNLRMGLTLGLSGMFNIGHDVGGFSGPAPEPELLVRWVQSGMLHPRFIMNSWKADGTVTTPWMHPSVVPLTRWVIQLRYRLVPYMYSLLTSATVDSVPVLRPTFLEFPEDENCWNGSEELLLGSFLLAAPIVEKGARDRTVYLPNGPQGWFDFYTEEYHSSGQKVTVAAPLLQLPLLASAGGIIPMTASTADFAKLHDEPSRVLRIFPPPTGTCTSSIVLNEDDGISLNGEKQEVKISVHSTESSVSVEADLQECKVLPYDTLAIALPSADARNVQFQVVNSGALPLKLVQQKFVWHPM